VLVSGLYASLLASSVCWHASQLVGISSKGCGCVLVCRRCKSVGGAEVQRMRDTGLMATALYLHGSILLRALKSKITVILTYAQKRYCGSSNYVKVLFNRITIITITNYTKKIFKKVLFCCEKPAFRN
jgi:hypothetical protein